MNAHVGRRLQQIWEDSPWFRAAAVTVAVGTLMLAVSSMSRGTPWRASSQAAGNAVNGANQLVDENLRLSGDQQRIAQDLYDKLTPEQRLLGEQFLRQVQQSSPASASP